MEYAVALVVLLCLVAWVVARPIRKGPVESAGQSAARRAELEAAKEAKYREIRDADLDRQMGKLSEADHRAVDRELRREAIEILRAIDELDGRAPRA